MGPNKAKRKYPSGAQKRKRAADKAERLDEERWLAASGWTQLSRSDIRLFNPGEGGPAVQLPIYGAPPAVSMAAVVAAINQLEQGAFYLSAYLWNGMLRDDRIASKSEERVDRLIGSPLQIKPADEDKRKAVKVAEELDKCLPQMIPTPQLFKLCRTAMAMSVGVAQVLTERTKDATYPTMQVWDNRNFRYDWAMRQYRMVTENRGEITIAKGDPEWILYEPYGPLGWLDSAKLRALAVPYLIRLWTRQWWARYGEVHGQPLRLGIIPASRDPKDERQFLQQLTNIGHEAVIRLAQGEEGNRFDLKLLEASANGWEGFQKLLEHCDDTIAIVFLGQSQSTRGQGGLGSQENAGESTILRLIRKDARVADVLREQLIKPWARDNFGDEELAPYLEWRIDPPEDEAQVAKTDLAIGQALVQFKTAGAPIDIRAYLEERGYPLLTEEEHAAQKDQAVADAQEAMGQTAPGDENQNQPPAEDAEDETPAEEKAEKE